MNRDEILKLPAGHKLNQIIWWKVFDMTPIPENNDMHKLPDYSGDISIAMQVAEKIGEMITHADSMVIFEGANYLTLVQLGHYVHDAPRYAASFDCIFDKDEIIASEWFDHIDAFKYAATAQTAAHAICLAAALIVMAEKEYYE